MRLKLISIYSPGGHLVPRSGIGHLVPRSGIVLAIFVEGHQRNIPVLLFQNPSPGSEEDI